MVKKILLLLLTAIFVIQFIHPKKNKSEAPQPNFLGNVHPVPENVKSILAKACLDCHSNNTRYPWYTKLQPVDWWIAGHIRNAKKQINFDEYSNRSLRYQFHKMEEIVEQVKENKMPLDSYTWIHKDARLTDEEKNTLINWATAIQDSMKAKYPIDSLIRKKQP